MGTSESKCAGTLLWKACKSGDTQKIQNIIEHPDADRVLNWKHPATGTTPLMEACRHGRYDAVEKMLSKGAPIDAKDSGVHENTALHYAAYYNQASCLRALLDKAVNPFLWNAKGHSAIDLARFRQKSEVERLLSYENTQHSGWIAMRKADRMISQWKRRYARLLRCSLNNHTYELALYRSPNDARPTHVIIYSPRDHVALPVEATQKWSSREHMFGFTQPILVQHPYAHQFSRDEERRDILDKTPKDPAVVHFAADDAKSMRQWLMVLNEPAISRKTEYEELFPPSEENIQPLFPSSESFNSPQSSIDSQQEFRRHTVAEHDPAPFCAMCGLVGVERSTDCPRCVVRMSAPVASAPPSILMDDIPPPSYHEAAAAIAPPIAPMVESRESVLVKPSPPSNHDTECVVCMDTKRDAVCVPCGHIAACTSCLEQMRGCGSGCPICRGTIQSVVRIYHA